MDPDALIDQLPGASEALKALARRGVARAYAKGRILIEERDAGDAMYIVLQGRLRAFSRDREGHEVTYNTLVAGDYFGEMSLDGGPRSASVETVEKSICAVVTRRTLESFVQENPAFAFELLAKVIGVARTATESLRRTPLSVYERIRLLLEDWSVPQPDGTRRATQRLTHQDIAHLIGCSREMVSRILKDLERGGYVTSDAGHLVVLKAPPPRW